MFLNWASVVLGKGLFNFRRFSFTMILVKLNKKLIYFRVILV